MYVYVLIEVFSKKRHRPNEKKIEKIIKNCWNINHIHVTSWHKSWNELVFSLNLNAISSFLLYIIIIWSLHIGCVCILCACELKWEVSGKIKLNTVCCWRLHLLKYIILFGNVISPLLNRSISLAPALSLYGWHSIRALRDLMQIIVNAFSWSQTDKSVLISHHTPHQDTLTQIQKELL